MMYLPREYIDDLLVRIAYHSSAIEGNTISLADTVTILLHETIPGKVSKREFYEIENHKQALEYVIDQLENNESLSLNIVRGIHTQLMDHLNFDRGMWKTHDNAIVGADFNTASAHDVPYLMKQWIDNLNYRLHQSKTDEEKIKHILEMHIDFERIHPFSDGNGRTGSVAAERHGRKRTSRMRRTDGTFATDVPAGSLFCPGQNCQSVGRRTRNMYKGRQL